MLIKKSKRQISLKKAFKDVSKVEILIVSCAAIYLSAVAVTVLLTGRKESSVKFSHGSGFYDDIITIKLKSPVIGSQIYFSKDGSSPGVTSILYTEPISIEKTTVIKARLFKNGREIGRETGHTYFINDKSSLPIVSLTADSDALWGENGIYTGKNQTKKGEEWVRDGVIEFYEPGQKMPAFVKDINFRIYGGKTRKSAQKSLKICTNQNDSIHYEVFPGYNVTKFKCLLLRNSGGDWRLTMFRDGLIQNIISENSLLTTQNYRPAVLYINGQYWGIHNIRELYNDNFFSNKYSGRRQDYAILFPDRDDKGRVDIEAGSQKDADDFYRLRQLAERDVQHISVINEIRQLMDIESFFDYNIFELYFANADWIESNIKIWRYNGIDKNENSIYGNDGKFRWLVYDLDSGLGTYAEPPYTANILKAATVKRDYSGRSWPYVILRRLLVSDITSPIFLDRYADLLNTTFRPENIIKKVDEYEKAIEDEMPRHIERWKDSKDAWGNPYIQSMEEWRTNVQQLRDFANDRPQHAYKHLIEHFLLTGTYDVTVNNSAPECGFVRINTININGVEWSGKYFNEVPVEIEAVPLKGCGFVKWENYDQSSNAIITYSGPESIYLQPIFEKK